MSMGCVHDFELIKLPEYINIEEDNDTIYGRTIKSAIIHDDVVDYIDSQIGVEDNLFYQVPSINPGFEEAPYKNVIPKDEGFNSCGVTIFNQYSIKELRAMFLQWRVIAEKMPEAFFHDLDSQYQFDRLVLLKNIDLCLNFVEELQNPQYILYHGGI